MSTHIGETDNIATKHARSIAIPNDTHAGAAEISRDTHRRFDTLHKWCQEWPIMSGITLTRIGLVGRIPADVCQFQFTTLGWLKLVSGNILKTGWSHN